MILGINLKIFLNSTTTIICNGVAIVSVTSERIFKSLMHFTLYWSNQHASRITKHAHNIINSHWCSKGSVTCLKPLVDQPHTTASHPPVSTPNKDAILYIADSNFFPPNLFLSIYGCIPV
jgi:hypothetical protein